MLTTFSRLAVVSWLLVSIAGPVARAGEPSLGKAVVASPEQAEAIQILGGTPIRGGVVVHLGCGDGKLTAALHVSESLLVQGLDSDPQNVEAARRYLQSRGIYGKVSAEVCNGTRLPYIDNLVNVIVVSPRAAPVAKEELLRVLAPGGFVCTKTGNGWVRLVKPRPQSIDDWTHYLHDASNNAVAHDAEVGPPRHLQWVCDPSWSRHHDHMASLSALVSAQGRVFYIMDEGPRASILLPSQWSLIARDAFNGVLLWKRGIREWLTQLWPLKSGPNQLPRRLVAVGDRVYATLGLDAPLSVLDAATGALIRTDAGTEHTDEIIASDKTLFLLVGHAPNAWQTYRDIYSYTWSNTNHANKDWAWDQAERSIMALDAETGKVLWKQPRRVAPLTLAADAQRVYFYDGQKVEALDRRSGKSLWASEPLVHKLPFPTGYGPTLVVQQGVVLLSVDHPTMTGFSAADGKKLWTSEHHHGGHASPDDMLVIGGLVWSGDVADGKRSGVFTGRDLLTGAVKQEFLPDVHPDWFHHRCYRSRGTDKYFIASRTGTEFIDLEAKHWDINHWVRGGCLYGFMPANGLMYEPPNSCGCFLESKLFGFNAVASESPTRAVPRDTPVADRLQAGPVYGEPLRGPSPAVAEEWPSYRHDGLRSGAVQSDVPAALSRLWQVELGGRLSSVAVAEGKAFVAAIDAHQIHALDALTGKSAWSFTAGGRIDSPPTIYRGRVLFGSADGFVYCLRSGDGKLVWRFRAAPMDRRMVAHDQLESAWPVSGSVLVANDTVYCVAGRCAFLDGGMRLVRLDPQSGRMLSETHIDDLDPDTGKNLQSQIIGQDMPVALPDILSSDGTSIYMRAQAFDMQGVRRHIAPLKLGLKDRRGGDNPGVTSTPAAREAAAEQAASKAGIGNHIFSRSGFLDDSWFWRSYWIYGKTVDSNYGAWLRPGHYAPCGRLMVLDDRCVYSFDRRPEYLCNATVAKYYLYRADREVSAEAIQRVKTAVQRINAASPDKSAESSDWATRKKFSLASQSAASYHWAEGNPPIQARALVLAGKTLFVAGPPILVDEEEAWRHFDDPAIQAKLQAQAEALQGRRGGQIVAVAAADGKELSHYDLGASPTFDGMAAAYGRLYLSTLDGKLVCLGAQGAPLPAALAANLAPIDTAVKPLSSEPGAYTGPSLAGDFTAAVHAEVHKSDLGYHLLVGKSDLGHVLQKLPVPATHRLELSARVQMAKDGKLKNCFLLFGDSTQADELVKCGLRFHTKAAMVIQGPMTGGKTTQHPFSADASKLYEIKVRVDLTTRQVTMTVDNVTVEASLRQPLKRISYVGLGATNAAVDFSPLQVVSH